MLAALLVLVLVLVTQKMRYVHVTVVLVTVVLVTVALVTSLLGACCDSLCTHDTIEITVSVSLLAKSVPQEMHVSCCVQCSTCTQIFKCMYALSRE
jgi:hypothetical protein